MAMFTSTQYVSSICIGLNTHQSNTLILSVLVPHLMHLPVWAKGILRKIQEDPVEERT
jgi:hypothetical protein